MTRIKKHKTFSIVVIIMTAIYLILTLFLDPVLESMVRKRLDSYVNDSPDRLYDIVYNNFQISVSDRAIRIGHVKISPRKLAIDSMKNNKLSMLISFKADSFYFDGLSIFKLLALNKLKLESIVSNRPTVKVYLNHKAKAPPKKSGLANSIISNKLKHGFIHNFKIKNGNFYIIKIPTKDSIYFKLNSSSFIVNDISIEPYEDDPISIIKFDSLLFTSGALYGGFIENYDIKADSIKLSTKHKTLQIDNFIYSPRHFSMANKRVQFAHDVISLKTDTIIFQGVDFPGNDKINGFHTSRIKFIGLDFSLSTDKRLPKNMNRKPLVGELIKKIPIPFNIDTIEITKSKIIYNEIVSADIAPLKVLFTRVNLLISNVTNDPALLSKNSDLRITAKTKFLNSGDLKLNIHVPLTSEEEIMIVTGHLGAMPFKHINKMLEGPMQVRFVSGNINSVNMDFIADTKHSHGKFLFDYSNLKIQEFKDKEDARKGVKEHNKWFMNALINGVIKKDNHKTDKKFVSGVIDYERPKDIAIPGYLFRSIKSGLISTFKPGTRRKAIKEEKKTEKEENRKENSTKKKNKK